MTFCTFIRYAESQIIKTKEFDVRKPTDLHMITKVQQIYVSTFMSRADINF